MSEEQKEPRESYSNAMIYSGALVGVILGVGAGWLLWPELAGLAQTWRVVAVGVVGMTVLAIALLAVTIWGGIVEAILDFFFRRRNR
jgi:hypothetical protein